MGLGDLVQSVVNVIETGRGRRVVIGALVVVLTLTVLYLHGRHTFHGLWEPEAMENAQLARNFAQGKGFTTQCLRPVDFWYTQTHAGKTYDRHKHPDIRRPPGFPALLAAVFAGVKPRFTVQLRPGMHKPDWRIIARLCIVLTAITAVLVFVLGTILFDARVGALGYFLFLLMESVLDASLSGTGDALAMLLSTAAAIAAVLGARWMAAERSAWTWAPCIAGAGALAGAGILTDYALLVLVPALVVVIGFGVAGTRRWRAISLFTLTVCLTAAPWFVRNVTVSGSVAGPGALALLEGSVVAGEGDLQRSVKPVYNRLRLQRALWAKLRAGVADAYDVDLRTMGNGILVCFFLVSLFYPLLDPTGNRLRWGAALSLALLVGAGALYGTRGGRVFNAFLPHVILFGTAFFLGALDREGLAETGLRGLLIALLIVLTGLPAAFRLAPGLREPYPPYYPAFVKFVCENLQKDEALCTDIPWASAWYGERTSVLLPRTIEDFEKLHGERGPFAALYLTEATQRRVREFGPDSEVARSWTPVLSGVVPEGFPFREGVFLPPGRSDQLFLADRVRWREWSPSGLAEDDADVRYEGNGP